MRVTICSGVTTICRSPPRSGSAAAPIMASRWSASRFRAPEDSRVRSTGAVSAAVPGTRRSSPVKDAVRSGGPRGRRRDRWGHRPRSPGRGSGLLSPGPERWWWRPGAIEGLGGDQGLAGGLAPGAVPGGQSVQQGGESGGIGGGGDADGHAALSGTAGLPTALGQAEAGELGQGLWPARTGPRRRRGRRWGRRADDGPDRGAIAGRDVELLGEVGVGDGIGESCELVGRGDDGRDAEGPEMVEGGRGHRAVEDRGLLVRSALEEGGEAVVPAYCWSISPTSPLSTHDPVSIGA